MRDTNLAKIDLNLLLSLEALLEERHVSNAAARLGQSQPATSRALSRLRDTFDDPLLVRTPEGYVTTPRADDIGKQLGQALDILGRTLAPPVFDPAHEADVFKICSLDYGEVMLIPTLVRQLRNAAPNIQLETLSRSHYSVKEVQSGEADVSIGLMPQRPPENCVAEQLFEDRYVCVMSRSHPLADSELTLESYCAQAHSVLGTGSNHVNVVDDRLLSLGKKRAIMKRSPHFLGSLFSLVGTDLIQTTTLRHVKPMMAPLNLIVKELPFDLEPISYCQIWNIRNTQSPSHRWFRNQIHEAAQTAITDEQLEIP